MKKFIKISLVVVIMLGFVVPTLVLAFSFEYVQQYNYYSYYEAGLFSGFWHGLIAPYSLIVRLLSPLDTMFSVDMYAYANTGWFYDFGFLVGIILSLPIGWLAAIVAFIVLII